MDTFTGAPFEYNSSIVNVNIDNRLAGILSQFNDDYIMDVVNDSLADRIRLYNLPRPNVVNAFETVFKELTNGFEMRNEEILATRLRVYSNIINMICKYYSLTFIPSDETDSYSIAYWLYDFLVSNFTENLKNFYAFFLIGERDSIYSGLELADTKKANDGTILLYSKKLFKNPKLAAIHCNLEYIISQINNFDIAFPTILRYVYQSNPNISSYISNMVSDDTGTFFRNFYQAYVLNSKDSADILTYIKLSLQQIGGEIE